VTRICIIQGHPSPEAGRFCHALARAYSDGAIRAGHEVRIVSVAELDFPVLRSNRSGILAKYRLPLPKRRSTGPSIC
jgi:putative NADPH-quinone reductase